MMGRTQASNGRTRLVLASVRVGTDSVPTLRACWYVEARLPMNLLRVTLVFVGKPAPTARRLGLAPALYFAVCCSAALG